MIRPRSSLLQATILLLLALTAACSSKTDCSCSYNCGPDALYCVEADGGLLCYSSLEAVPGSGDEDVTSPPADDLFLRDDAWEPPEETATEEDLEPLPDDITPPPDGPTSPDTEEPVESVGELRGIWVTRWDYDSPAAIETILDNAAEFGFNAVFFQVRGNADAYYASTLEPWARGLTGTLGQDPGWDPLAVAVAAAHERGLELHAWVNTFTAWTGTTPPAATDPPHILYAHPEWRVVDANGNPMAYNDSYTFVSPGIPEVRAHIIAVVTEIATSYDVDGIHFDYIRYPGPQFSHDAPTLAAFEAAKADDPGLIWGNFQRQVLSDFVGDAYDALTQARPEVKVSAAVWGIYKDSFGWGGTSEGFFDYYQDSHAWLAAGSLDALCPMTYWAMTDPKGGWTDFATLADDHLGAAAGRHVYMGIKGDYGNFAEIADQIEYLRASGAPGYVVFSYATLTSKGYGASMALDVNDEPIGTATMPWK